MKGYRIRRSALFDLVFYVGFVTYMMWELISAGWPVIAATGFSLIACFALMAGAGIVARKVFEWLPGWLFEEVGE